MTAYLLTINAVTFLIMLYDKYMAKKQLRRVPESTLLALAGIGGSLGCLLAMYTVRHKTRKPKFKYGIPILLTVQLLLTGCLLFQ